MNTGNTRPYPHKRGRDTFRSMDQYDYEHRRRLPDYSAVVELTVLGGVPNLRDCVIKVEHASVTAGQYIVSDIILERGKVSRIQLKQALHCVP